MKITDYERVAKVDNADLFITETSGRGTKTINKQDLTLSLFDDIPEMHKQIWGGRSLGTSVSTDQLNNIRNGSFKGLWVGDYWTIRGITWRIVDFNYFYWLGDVRLQSSHVVVMPDQVVQSQPAGVQMDQTTNAPWGYGTNMMRGVNISSSKSVVNLSFPNIVLKYRDRLESKAPEGGLIRNWEWFDCEVELPSLMMLRGSSSPAVTSSATAYVSTNTIGAGQFAAFRLAPRLIAANNSVGYWLRDYLGTDSVYPFIDISGAVWPHATTWRHGVRPFFLIG